MKQEEKKLTSNFKYLRNLYGYTQDETAEAVHLARCTYTLLENGTKVPLTDTFLKLSEFYGISIDAIVRMEPEKIINDLIYTDRCRDYVVRLLQIYNNLSGEGKATLLCEARQLVEEEKAGNLPHFNPEGPGPGRKVPYIRNRNK